MAKASSLRVRGEGLTIAIADYDLKADIRALPGYDPYTQGGDRRFDEDAGRLAVDFVQMCCTHVKGELAGEPLILEQWQRGLFGNLYGWKRPDGTRRYRESLVFIPRGNSKTTMAAAIVNVHLFLEPEAGSEIYSLAADEKQARYCYEIVAAMIRNERRMNERAEILQKAIVVGDKSYKPVSAHPGGKHGYAPQLIVNDELHAQPTREPTEALMTGTVKRSQPLVVHLSTSDYEREGSICNEKHDYATKVRDGLIEDSAFLPCIYEARGEDDWKDPRIWAKANPNLGVSVSREYLERECQRAQESPAYENTFKRLHLNMRTESAARWVTSEAWAACGNSKLAIEDFAGEKCWAGLDLASTSDFTACVFVFEGMGVYYAFPYFWVPRDTATKREHKARVPYAAWQRAGHLAYTEGNTTDYDVVRRDVGDVVRQHKLRLVEIAADRLFQGLDICRRLAEDDGFNVIEHGQGFAAMALPTKETERLILAGKLGHPENPVLNWMLANTAVQTDAAGNRKPDKKRSHEKIDGTVALIMAAGRAVTNAGPKRSVYAKREMRTL